MDLIEKAKEFATKAHGNQMRFNGLLYISHPEEVAGLVQESGGSENEIVASWLHDTVEDTPVTIEDIEREFGSVVKEIVEGLTDLDEWLPLPLLERKLKQAERARNESEYVRRVKLADQISNVRLVCTGPYDGFDFKHCQDYIHGAKQIAGACKGINVYLDTEFDTAYQRALIVFHP